MRELLPLFPKPGHYAGIEEGARIKNPASVSLRIGLAFPDSYEVGMSYLGHKILYDIINSNPRWWAERVMAPGIEAGKILSERNAPLATLESDTPLGDLHLLGFAITHELCYTDVLRMLDLARIPLRSLDRSENIRETPIIMAGGGAMLGAEPLTPFLDLAALGDGEEMMPEILELLEKALEANWSRSRFLEEARHIPGVYVPAFFEHAKDGNLISKYPGYRPARRVVADLDAAPYPARQVVPIGAIHERLVLEIARGCSRGCRFCHAGSVYRPVRERSVETINKIMRDSLKATGFEEISLLSLSAGDYSALKTLCCSLYSTCAAKQITLSLPSLRVGSVDEDIMSLMASLRRTGVTLAPEAGSQRLRDIINKGITEEGLISHARKLAAHGWKQIKLYFMIGLPGETDDDLRQIAALCKKVREAGRPDYAPIQVTAALSPFVPKPFTPFQWEAQADRDEIMRRINLVRDCMKNSKGLTVHWHDPDSSYLEGLLSRSGRELADVVEKAYKKGAIFCGWNEFFDLRPWLEAFEECGIDIPKLLDARPEDKILPWDHLEGGVSKHFLLTERKRAHAAKVTDDCRYNACRQCGACDTKAGLSLLPRASGGIKKRLVYEERDQASPGIALTPPVRFPQAATLAHYRIWHAKMGNFAWISQLELQSVIERTLRRARLPLAFSKGFHPLPQLSFGRALPVGVRSEVEWFGITLTDFMAPLKITALLKQYLPEDLGILHINPTDKKRKTEQAIAETFRIEFEDETLLPSTAASFADFAAADEFTLERVTKKGQRTDNIRPLLLNWSIHMGEQGKSSIIFTADWSDSYLSPLLLAQTILSPGKPDPEFLCHAQIIKTAQIFADGARIEKN